MSHSYPKMLNLFKFHEPTKGRTTEFSCPEFKYLQYTDWVLTEKIDGTNVRVIFDDEGLYEIRGRTDRAQLHNELKAAVDKIFRPLSGDFQNMTFYGEGYGPGIQKGGHYAKEKSFALFDVFVPGDDYNEGYYLPWEKVHLLATACNIPLVPEVVVGSLREGYMLVRNGLQSLISNEGDFAEGLVGRPVVPIRGMRGDRLIVKIKHRDYYGKELVSVTVSA